ncbi:MAG: hypothetical protein H0V97_06985 [Actinobacteria bacterium]|nr:hypothetical protein [Actinomycetota bacterium]
MAPIVSRPPLRGRYGAVVAGPSHALGNLMVMEAQAWTAIGLLAATLLGTLFYLGQRIDGLGERIDSLGARLDARIDSLAGDLRGQASRIDALGVRVEEQGTHLADRIYELSIRLDNHLRRHAG